MATSASNWFKSNSALNPDDTTTTGAGLIDAAGPYDKGSGEFGVQTATTTTPTSTSPTMLNLGDLDRREVDANKETVSGNLNQLISDDSKYIQAARAGAAQTANSRGLLNSSMAAGAGEAEAIKAALPIATSDAGIYGKAADYNTALTNQGRMYNADQANALNTAKMAQDAQAKIAQLQADTSRYAADKQAATAENNADNTFKQAQLDKKTTLVNNIIQTADLSPDRKAELLRQMGEPALAAAIYVVDSTKSDLTGTTTWG